MSRRCQTQWAGQFGVAHELTRRGYLVTFTAGNAPGVDLLCQSPSGIAFSIQVKSLSSRTYFLYQQSLEDSSIRTRFFVFVMLPTDLSLNPQYYVMNSEQFLRVVSEQKRVLTEAEERRGKPYAPFSPGINYGVIVRMGFRDAWANLPA
jgi:hypothetical protein